MVSSFVSGALIGSIPAGWRGSAFFVQCRNDSDQQRDPGRARDAPRPGQAPAVDKAAHPRTALPWHQI